MSTASPIRTSVKPESSSIFCQPARGSPPAIQPVQRSMSRNASGGTGRPLAMSANCSHPPGRNERVEAGAGADIDDVLASVQGAQRERVADAREGLDSTVRQSIYGGLVIAQAGCGRPAGVEVVRRVGLEGHSAVLLAHLAAERFRIDEQVLWHRSASVASRNRQAGVLPLRKPVLQPSGAIAAPAQLAHSVVGVDAVL